MTRKKKPIKENLKVNLDAMFFDSNTGEEITNIALVVPRKSKLTNWLRLFHRGTEIMAKDRDITSQTYRVFMYSISYIDYENRITVTQSQVAEALDMKRQHVSTQFRLLVKKGIFEEDKKYGSLKTYRLNTEIGWKGKPKNLKERAKAENTCLKSKIA